MRRYKMRKNQIIALNSISIFIGNLLLNNLITGILFKFEKQSTNVIWNLKYYTQNIDKNNNPKIAERLGIFNIRD